jgi:hypothetical protein
MTKPRELDERELACIEYIELALDRLRRILHTSGDPVIEDAVETIIPRLEDVVRWLRDG